MVHVDAYRVNDDDDLYSTGFYDCMEYENCVCAVEWSEKIPFAIPDDAVTVTIEYCSTEAVDNIPAGEENIDFSHIISLNPTAAYLWENIVEKESFTIEDMVQLLLDEYEVKEDIAREDCELIAERWAEMGLIE